MPAGLLERHARRTEAVRRHRVAVAGVEEVVDVVVEVRDPARVELVLHRRPVQVVDPAHRLVGDLVVDRVRVRREEVAGGVAHLVRVDEQHGRIAAQQLDLAIRLGLRAGEPVAVHVEPVGVAPGVGLATVGILRRQDHHDRLVEDPLRRAVATVRELVEDAQRRVGPALLAAVHVAGHPQDRGALGRDPRRLGRGSARVHQGCGRAPDALEAPRRHVRGAADDRVPQRPALHRRGGDTGRHARARPVDREQVLIGLGGRDVARAELDPDHLLRGRHLAAETRGPRVAGRLRDGRRGGREQQAGDERRHGLQHFPLPLLTTGRRLSLERAGRYGPPYPRPGGAPVEAARDGSGESPR